MPARRIAEPVLVIGRRPSVAAPHHHAIALAGAAMTRRAVDVEPLLTSRHHFLVNRKRKYRGVGAVDLAGEEKRIIAQLPSSNRARDERTRGTLIGEKRRLPDWDVLWLVVHVLPAASHRDTEKKDLPQRHRATENVLVFHKTTSVTL